jgi:hypothetical protein
MRSTMTIASIINTPIPPSLVARSPARLIELTSPPISGRTAIPDVFECTVLTFLFEHRQTLGIARLFHAKNLLVDGGLTLADGRFLAVEIKYRMNWLKACQTGWQLGQFTRMPEAGRYRPVGGVVFFEEFSGVWARRRGEMERGWLNWYADHAVLPGDDTFRVDLVRFRQGHLEAVPASLGPSLGVQTRGGERGQVK